MPTIRQELERAAGMKQSKDESKKEFTKRLVKYIARDLADPDWDKLSEEAQDWNNAAVLEVDAGRFPEFPDESPDPVTVEEAQEIVEQTASEPEPDEEDQGDEPLPNDDPPEPEAIDEDDPGDQQETETMPAAATADVNVPARRGRPPKNVEPVAPPARRGRPPKAATAAEPAPVPARRGRPPAAPVAVTSAAPARRGRPPAAAKAPEPVPARRGRPPGKTNGHAAPARASAPRAANSDLSPPRPRNQPPRVAKARPPSSLKEIRAMVWRKPNIDPMEVHTRLLKNFPNSQMSTVEVTVAATKQVIAIGKELGKLKE